ncbi:tyrosine-type recombinase/integrase [Oceanisphaera ostreae]|uniref:Tyrosine-type recombinase/integrase n=1 Tax=Oceanisphaera ostreae TaxID=914151 RepID=A0ABW3KIU7_9GAMM
MSKKPKFTMTRIQGLKPRPSAYYEWDSTGQRGLGRLGIKIQSSGQKVFVFRFFDADGKAQFITIGKFPEMSLSHAREQACEYGALLKQGINPKVEAKRLQVAEETLERAEALKGSVRQLFEGYTNSMKAEGKRTFDAVLSSLEKEAYPIVSPDMKAKEVTADHIKRILSNLIIRGAAVQSNRVRSYLMAAFNYGLKHDNDPAHMEQGVLFALTANPVSVIPKQTHAEKPGQNWLKLPYLRELMTTFSDAHKVGTLIHQLLKLVVYCGGQRPYELLANRWESVDWVERTLLVPADLSKNKREHLIPLTDTSFSLLRELYHQTGICTHIFPKLLRRQYSPNEHILSSSLSRAISYYRKHNPDFPYFVARDIRRTCKTLMGEAGLSKEIRDRIQNHAFQDVSAKHYDRYDYLNEKRHALELWEARLNQEDAVSNVVNLR